MHGFNARGLVTVLIVGVLLLASNPYMVSSDSVKLTDIKGEYKIFEINKYEGVIIGGFESMARDFDHGVAEILNIVNRDPYGVKENLSLVGVAETGMGEFYVYKGEYKGHKVEVVIGDKGDFRIVVDDGVAAPWFTCRSLMEKSSWVFSYFLGEEYSEPVYVGLSGDGAVAEVRAYQCDVATGTCEWVENATAETMYENPYELYRFEIEGLPIKPYIKIRCTDPEMHDGFMAVYVEGFLPRLYTDRYEIVKVDDEYLESIISLLRDNGVTVSSASDVVVEDFYYTVGFDDTLAPTLILRAGSMMAVVQLYPDGPRVTAIAQLAGAGGGVMGVSAVDWDEVLSNVRPLSEDESGWGWNTLILVPPVVVVAVLLAGYKLARARR